MMALLNRRQRLPAERARLYEKCADLLVEGWDTSRHLERSDYLGQDDKLEILQQLAFEMQREREGLAGNSISEIRLKKILTEALENRRIPNPRGAAGKIVDALAERDFMLCFAGDDQYAFVHRTFLEYFCAKEYKGHLENAGDPEELHGIFRAKWLDDAWHEVLRLVCGMVGPDLAGRLVSELLSSAQEKLEEWKAVFLAAECLNEVRQLGRVESARSGVKAKLIDLIGYELPYPYDFWHPEYAIVQRVRTGAVQQLCSGWRDDSTRQLLQQRATSDTDSDVRYAAITGLAQGWRDDSTRQLLQQRATSDTDSGVRDEALRGLARGWWHHPDMQALLGKRAVARGKAQ